MEIIIFQLLSCLYLYNSGILVPVRIWKQIRYTGFWPVALIYRAAGIPASGGGVDIPCRRYTDFWRRREVCAKSVYLASGVQRVNSLLMLSSSYWNNFVNETILKSVSFNILTLSQQLKDVTRDMQTDWCNVHLLHVAALRRTRRMYVTSVKVEADNVPFGMAWPGSLSSPLSNSCIILIMCIFGWSSAVQINLIKRKTLMIVKLF